MIKKLCLVHVLGFLPQRLLVVNPPKFEGCLCGYITRFPWNTNSPQNGGKIQRVTAPGDFDSIYQLESSTTGFIAQLKVTPTKQRYNTATIFIDNHSDISYVQLQMNLTPEETVKSKRAFEVYTQKLGVNIDDNYREITLFNDKIWQFTLLFGELCIILVAPQFLQNNYIHMY